MRPDKDLWLQTQGNKPEPLVGGEIYLHALWHDELGLGVLIFHPIPELGTRSFRSRPHFFSLTDESY